MKKRIYIYIAVICIFIIQANLVFASNKTDNNQKFNNNTEEVTRDTTSNHIVEIDIINYIKNIDVNNSEKNVLKYKEFLKSYDVQDGNTKVINELIVKYNKIDDVLIAYSFINDYYGTTIDLKTILKNKTEGKSWSDIFSDYSNKHTFVPREFNVDDLENYLSYSSISSDDIVIIDRISFVSGEKFKDILLRKVEGEDYSTIKENLNICNSEEKLGRVKITNNKLEYYLSKTELTQEEIVNCYVLALKLKVDVSEIIKLKQKNITDCKIYENILTTRFK